MPGTLGGQLSQMSLDKLVARELDPAEFPRLLRYEPFATMGKPPNAANSRVFVLEDEQGELKAFWVRFVTVHIEPLWISPELRAKAGPLRRMWRMLWENLLKEGWKVAYAVIADQDLPHGNASFAQRAGLVKIPGSLYYVVPENIPDLGRVVRLASEQAPAEVAS
jgi:hypothetical protein